MLKKQIEKIIDQFVDEFEELPLKTLEDCDAWDARLKQLKRYCAVPKDLEDKVRERRQELSAQGSELVKKLIQPLWISGVREDPTKIFKSATWVSFRGIFTRDKSKLEVVWGENFRSLVSLHRSKEEVVAISRWNDFSDSELLKSILLRIDCAVQTEKKKWERFGTIRVGPLTLFSNEFGMRRRVQSMTELRALVGEDDGLD